MKKIIYSFILLVFIISLIGNVNAYSTSKYSIDIPSTYSKVGEGAYVKENGDSININISSYSGGAPSFNEETLNELEKMLRNQILNERDSIVDIFRKKNQEYGLGLTESQINEFAKSVKINSMEKKELTTCSKNKYDAYHFIASYSMVDYSAYIEQYYIVTKTDLYIISIGSSDKSNFTSNETINMLNSFKITNYEKPNSFFSDELWGKMIGATVVAAICGIIKIFSDKKKKDNYEQEDDIAQEKTKNDTTQEKTDIDEERKLDVLIKKLENDENIENQSNNEVEKSRNAQEMRKHCTKCGEEIEEDWDFCNNCGNKLK